MARTPNPYKKLGGRGLRWIAVGLAATRSQLWLAADHLLVVETSRNTEEYRRFYFRDIEAIVIRRTAGRQIWNWILAILALLTILPFFAAWRTDGGGGFLVTAMGFAIFWFIFILFNSLRGATCQAHIRTAVQLEPLPSLARLPAARRALARLYPLILGAQGEATPEELVNAPWMAGESMKAAAAPSAAAPSHSDKSVLHAALFGLLLAEAIITAIYLALSREPVSAIGLLLMLSGFVVNIVAMVRETGPAISDGVRVVTKGAIGYYLLKCCAGFVFAMTYAFHHPGAQVITGLEIIDEPGLKETSMIGAALAAILGLAGLILLLSSLRRRQAARMV